MMSAKLATPGVLKLMVFWNKVYDVIIRVDDVTNKILSRGSNYLADVFMWPKFGNSINPMREVTTTSIQRNSYVCRSYRGKTVREGFLAPPLPPHPE